MKPTVKTSSNCFSSGPCKKRPGFDLGNLNKYADMFGRSHRSSVGKKHLKDFIDRSSNILQLPEGYKMGIIMGSDTAAVEAAMWNFLGHRPVDCFFWEAFGKDWMNDIVNDLKIENANSHTADYGSLPDLSKANPENDIVFTYNGTTSGVQVPNLDWISDDRKGIVICDATSAVLANDIDWSKIDILTYSWQKAMGGEAGFGSIVMSPRAIEMLEAQAPKFAIPKLFKLVNKGKVNMGFFDGITINTPSLLALADGLDILDWLEENGSLEGSISKIKDNSKTLYDWINSNPNFEPLCQDTSLQSRTSVCFNLSESAVSGLSDEQKNALVDGIIKLLAKEEVAYDMGSYKTAPKGFRVWCGCTVEAEDIKILTQWIEWAFSECVKGI